MFKITESARGKLGELIIREQQSPNEKLFVRLSMGIGWGGPKLNLSLEERKITGDVLFEFDGIGILIHEQDYVYFDHTKLDYVKDVMGNPSFTLLRI